ncbi:MAG: Crp/Fnr family transcriptional regulator [Pyrinomonadaceae bacterium]
MRQQIIIDGHATENHLRLPGNGGSPHYFKWDEMDEVAQPQGYPPGLEVFQQGALAQSIYFIEEGIVKLVYLDQDGRELIVDLRFPGWVLGLDAVVVQKPYPVAAITSTKCYLRRIPAKAIRNLLETDARISGYIHQMHSIEAYEHVAKVAQLACFSARQRLEQLLWRFISALGTNELQNEVRLQLPLKHREIAQLLAVTPEHLSRILKQMEHDGVISQQRGWLIISDAQKHCKPTDFY